MEAVGVGSTVDKTDFDIVALFMAYKDIKCANWAVTFSSYHNYCRFVIHSGTVSAFAEESSSWVVHLDKKVFLAQPRLLVAHPCLLEVLFSQPISTWSSIRYEADEYLQSRHATPNPTCVPDYPMFILHSTAALPSVANVMPADLMAATAFDNFTIFNVAVSLHSAYLTSVSVYTSVDPTRLLPFLSNPVFDMSNSEASQYQAVCAPILLASKVIK